MPQSTQGLWLLRGDWHNREVDAMMTALADLGIAPKWWGGAQFRQAAEQLLKSQEDL